MKRLSGLTGRLGKKKAETWVCAYKLRTMYPTRKKTTSCGKRLNRVGRGGIEAYLPPSFWYAVYVVFFCVQGSLFFFPLLTFDERPDGPLLHREIFSSWCWLTSFIFPFFLKPLPCRAEGGIWGDPWLGSEGVYRSEGGHHPWILGWWRTKVLCGYLRVTAKDEVHRTCRLRVACG